MDCYIRFCNHEGLERIEAAGDSIFTTINEAERLSIKYDGVEVIVESGKRIWPAETHEEGSSHDVV